MNRIYHTWDKWECYPAGFYSNKHPTLDEDQCRDLYASFLRDTDGFERAMGRVLIEWPNSSEHYLSNESMNRIAWLGQASMCITHGVPSVFRGGFNRLTEAEQLAANLAALKFLNIWLALRGEPTLTLQEAQSKTEANLY
jgi:hypothetical protein